MIYKPVPHIIRDIVSDLRNNFSEDKIIPFYEYGTALEVVNTLSKKTEHPEYSDKKYPLIWFLIKDSLKQEVDFTKANKRKVTDITVIFCTETKADYLAADRYENTFIPILRPLYDAFVYYLKRSKDISSKNDFKHIYYENLFWGRDGLYGHEGNIFNDRLDAIIIDNLDLHLIETC
jgi:hypothetical protein